MYVKVWAFCDRRVLASYTLIKNKSNDRVRAFNKLFPMWFTAPPRLRGLRFFLLHKNKLFGTQLNKKKNRCWISAILMRDFFFYIILEFNNIMKKKYLQRNIIVHKNEYFVVLQFCVIFISHYPRRYIFIDLNDDMRWPH